MTEKKKKKILMLSDHALSTSGVGVQSRHLIEGLIATGEWTVRQFGAAMKHDNYDTVVVNEDFIIKPIDGFGDRDLLRVTLATERPDVLLIFTDPRFFTWLFEMEDEVHQICPIVWWHVWDNYPTPRFNDIMYEATDLINCHSYLTYEMCQENFPNKTNFIPHTLPDGIFHPLPENEIIRLKQEAIGPERLDHFVVFWVNRNAKRKRPNDLLWAWQKFMAALEERHGHQKASLLLHTDPNDQEGPNLYAASEMLGISDSVIFSTDRVDFAKMNALHNISDTCINISYAEGFGLPTLESMQCGNPIIAVKTGGQTRQVVDHRDGSHNGIALDVDMTSLVGSQTVPYIYEDYASVDKIADALLEMFELGQDGRRSLGLKAKRYVEEEFSHEKTIGMWNNTLNDTVVNWRERRKRWVCKTI